MNILRLSLAALLAVFLLAGCEKPADRPTPPNDKIIPTGHKFRTSRPAAQLSLIVLGYHGIGTDAAGYNLSADKFKNQVGYLAARGYQPIGIKELYGHLYNKEEIPAKSFLLTFDDALISDYNLVFPYLVENGLKAIFFVPTDHIGREGNLTKQQIREMNGHDCCDFGSHSRSHKNLYTLNAEALAEELGGSKEILEEITGEEVKAFAYPNGFFTERSITALRDNNYKLAFTVMPGRNDFPASPFEIRRITLSESVSDENFKMMVDGDPDFYRPYYSEMYAKSTRNKLDGIAHLCEEELRRYEGITYSFPDNSPSPR
ncbi:MAG: polysaccharide deacetylase family protein [Desulfurivibrionaceae bacterium]|nr:polysaccharide deacetylase family protein [Desulfurivibrionaceae bacterium]